MKNIYCDISATTPLSPEVDDFISKIQRTVFGNPSSIHRFGQASKAVIENARRQVSDAIHCSPGEIYFTGCGSESDNLVLHGIPGPGDHLIISTYEHPAVKKPAAVLESAGTIVTRIPPGTDGRINPAAVEKAIRPETKLVSIMMVNNEIGSVNDVAAIGEICKAKHILFHTDGVQALGKIPIDLQVLPIDFLSMSAHKVYGPKGVGALFIRRGVSIPPLMQGGGQEKNLRPGTENIPGIAGFGLAAKLAAESLNVTSTHLKNITDRFLAAISHRKIQYFINGSHQVPGVLNIYFPGIDAQSLVIRMDMAGIAISAGSACSSGTTKPAGALLDMGLDRDRASASVRISFGKYHTIADMESVAEALENIVLPLQKEIFS